MKTEEVYSVLLQRIFYSPEHVRVTLLAAAFSHSFTVEE